MPCDNCSNEELVKTKTKKSYKKESVCDVNCKVDEKEANCCSIPYQRLEKLRNGYSFISSTGYKIILNDEEGDEDQTPCARKYRNGHKICNPHFLRDEDDQEYYRNTVYAYYFVNSHRYLNFESCGKQDQVVGWYVDTSCGQLKLFQNLPELNLTTNTSRKCLLNKTEEDLTSVEKNQLHNMNIFYKLALKAIEKVGQNPKEEGNIVEVHDKSGNKWLVNINRAKGTEDVCDFNSKYVVVGIQRC